ncbi:MAG: glycerophosphodiester phosphodiesterase family protein [Pseudomonadota bacterium]
MKWTRRTAVAGLGGSLLASSIGSKATAEEAMKLKPPQEPMIIAHRGASGKRPEHTLGAYRLGHSLYADAIEPDLVFTKDGHLICRHDRYLSTTTNVADLPQFADRRTLKPGRKEADWFAEDFTLEEIGQLRARTPVPGRKSAFDDTYTIPTFAEVLEEAEFRYWRLFPEIKQPSVAASLGFDVLKALQPFFDRLNAGKLQTSFMQCFEPDFLKSMPKVKNLNKVQLLYLRGPDDWPDMAEIAKYADAIGPNKSALVTPDLKDSGLVKAAKDAGLKIYPWTFRSDDVPAPFKTPGDEYKAVFDLGVNGVFTDFPLAAFNARRDWLKTL